MIQAPYFSFKNYMKENYTNTLHSIPIDLDLGCPNRDTNGAGGCTFCPSNGARAAQTLDTNSVQEQIQKAITFSKNRYKAKDFMLYIQAYTGTFTSVINQKKVYSKLLSLYNFKAISIGTRPDCLNKKTLEYLKELNEQIDVYIDLGVQTLNDTTLKRINRGHDASCSIKAIKKLKEYGIKVFAHIIVGLEKETRKDWLHTVKELVKHEVDGIKIHNLHIIKNTLLHKEYEKNKFKTLDEYEYAQELIYLIRNIPKNIAIVRISTDTPSSDLVAPIWHMQKGQFVEYVNQQMIYAGYTQGDMISKQEVSLQKENTFKLKDKSITVWDKIHKDYYHPKSGALLQAKEAFIKQSKLKEKLEKKDIDLLDIGFGMGYNSLCSIFLEKKHKLKITAIDKNRVIIKTASKLIEDENYSKVLEEIFEKYSYKDEFNSLNFIVQDARFALKNLEKKFDIIYLDSFLHNLNASLLSYDFFKLLKNVLKSDGVIICSQTNHIVKVALAKANFVYEKFTLEKTDIKALVIKHGINSSDEVCYEDEYLVYRDKQIVTNKEQQSL